MSDQGYILTLAGLRLLEPDLCNASQLVKHVPHVKAIAESRAGASYAVLDGEFTSGELRAIAAWMDEPAAVAAAYGDDVARRAGRA